MDNLQGAIVNFEKETAQLHHAIDKFFGTSFGYKFNEIIETRVKQDSTNYIVTREELDKSSVSIFEVFKNLKLAICGGTITSIFTNANVNDLDFYMMDPTKKTEVMAFFLEYFAVEWTSSNAITFVRKSTKSNKKWRVQLITNPKFSGEPHEVFEWFDFTITHGAYRFDTCEFVFGDRFLQDLSKRRLVYSGNSRYPICAMYRTKKYVARGFELSGATIMHIALCIVQLKINSYAELKEQLMGIDTMYLQKLLEAKDPNAPVNYGEFIYDAFQLIDHIGSTLAEIEDEE